MTERVILKVFVEDSGIGIDEIRLFNIRQSLNSKDLLEVIK